jgi:predicted DsbA family dithiol-disulfide isomerase
MTARIKLDLVSDIVCPWCIIGYKRLQQAIKASGAEDRIDIEWQPFELNPGMPAEGENLRAHIARKYGSSAEEYQRTQANLEQLGTELDFRFDFFDDMNIVNTEAAHILLDYAKDFGKQTELQLRLFDAYFNERKDISDRQVLQAELQSLDLDTEAALLQLDSNEAHERVKTAETFWQGHGISSVPTVVFNRSSALTGAQPVAVYQQVLTELLTDETPTNPRATI